jgi:hypothetical protein
MISMRIGVVNDDFSFREYTEPSIGFGKTGGRNPLFGWNRETREAASGITPCHA